MLDPSRHQSQAGCAADGARFRTLHAEVREELHAHAHAQQWAPESQCLVADRIGPSAGLEQAHAVGEISNAREDQAVIRVHVDRPIHEGRRHSQLLERAQHGTEVANAVVDDPDFHGLS